ncbi:MAG: VWA domain-containing protein [Acidobacteriota bacterium]
MPRRKAGLLVNELEGEILVFDRRTLQAHCLSGPGILVFYACDGETALAVVARRLEEELRCADGRELLETILAMLAEKKLVKGWRAGRSGSRRRFLALGGRLGLLAPILVTVAAPAPAEAMSAQAGLPVVTTSDPDPELGIGIDAGTPGEAYDHLPENPFRDVATDPVVTFSIDVDTASYSNVRRFLASGSMPPPDAVRIEELLNYFTYDYPGPGALTTDPFQACMELSACPWEPSHRLLMLGIQGRRLDPARIPARNLVFLLDVSGSMASADKLPLLKASMRALVMTLTENDRVAIVVYAGASGVVLPPTSGNDREAILAALDKLEAGGSTNGGEGIRRAYDLAIQSFMGGGVNRVILATDGDFNVGITSRGGLLALIDRMKERGVFLTVLGFGTGDLKDATMEQLADRGNGNYAYIDSLAEGRKVLVKEGGATLVTIAKDVKLQLELDPARVASYRLIGYENRLLAKEDFDDDQKDAGEIGAGHAVTALVEIVEVPGSSGDLGELKIRYKEPDGVQSKLISSPVTDARSKAISTKATADFRFAAAVAAFGMLLRQSRHAGKATHASVVDLAEGAIGPDASGQRRELVKLARAAWKLAARKAVLDRAAGVLERAAATFA